MMPRGWSYSFGEHPDRVTVYEDLARKGRVYLHWRVGPDGARRDTTRSTGIQLRDGRHRLLTEKVDEAKARAKAKYHELVGLALGTAPAKRALTIGDGMALAFDADRGKYPVDKPYRREVRQALMQACAVWGRDRTWASLTKGDLRELWRRTFKAHRAQDQQGHRATEIVIARVFTVAAWLREEDQIPPVAWLPWKHWRTELREDVEEIGAMRVTVERPRYTIDEMRKLLRTARDVDPRWDLLLRLGAGLRLGQVVRAMRSNLLRSKNAQERLVWFFDLRAVGRKHKKGAARLLTTGQARAFAKAIAPEGYLHALEEAYQATGTDYPLFFGHALARKTRGRKSTTAASKAKRVPLSTGTLRDFMEANEFLAGVPHVRGRGWTGLRRITVDAGKQEKISREAMRELGGWADNQMPDTIYADDEALPAREEARDAMARILEEPEEDDDD